MKKGVIGGIVVITGYSSQDMKRKPHPKRPKPTPDELELIKAIEARDFSRVEALLKTGVSPNASDEHGTPALNSALYGTRKLKEGDEKIALLLLGAGADPDKADADNTTPLMLACKNGFKILVAALLGRGVGLNVKTNRGVFTYSGSPLSIAADKADREIVRMLVKAGADVNQPIQGQMNPLTPAASSGDIVMVRELIAAGAKATGISLFAPIGQGRLDMVKELIAAAADVNVRDRWGNSVLGSAVEQGDAAIVRAIIQAGANLDAVSGGRTPLVLATVKQNTELVHMLLDAGANVDARDIYKFTALMEAAIRPNKQIISTLLTAGANPRLKAETGESAITLAKQKRMLDNLKLLEAALKGK